MTPNENNPPANLDWLIGGLVDQVRQNLERDGHLAPVVFVIRTDKREIDVVSGSMGSTKEKDYIAEAVRQRARRMQADAICLVTEAWSLPPEDAPHAQKICEQYGSLSSYPGRIEIVAISIETTDGVWMAQAPITRTQGKPSIELPTWYKAEASSGRFMHLLPVIHATPAEVDALLARIGERLVERGAPSDVAVMVVRKMEPMLRQAPRKAVAAFPLEEMVNKVVEDLVHPSAKKGAKP